MTLDDTNCVLGDEMEPGPELNRWTSLIIGACIEVHRALGPGFLESVYEEALAVEFTLRGIPFKKQVSVNIYYKEHTVGEHRLDFLVADKIVLELKAVTEIAVIHKAIVKSYLKATHQKLALIVNFNVILLKDGIARIAL
ncbi:MAG: GxxExxY protein [Tepidisphaerales bacterium]